MPASKEDRELDILLSQLRAIQRDVKGDEGDESKQSKRGGKKEERFAMLKSSILRRLSETCNLMDESGGKKMLSSVTDPQAIIAKNQELRSQLRSLDTEWAELNSIHQKEQRKKRSKVSKEEMQIRRQLLTDLRSEISELKGIHQQGVVNGMQGGAGAGGVSLAAIQEQPALSGPNQDARPAKLTQQQHVRIQAIRERQQDMENKYLSIIEDEVEKMGAKARAMNEEQKRQEVALDVLDEDMTEAREHVQNSNKRMKEVLKKVRAADKFCVDAMCIIFTFALAGVLYAVIDRT